MWTAKPNEYQSWDSWNLTCFLKFLCRGQKASHLQLQSCISLWGSCLKAGSEGLELHRWLVEGQKEEKIPLCRMPLPPPVPDPLSGSCRAGDKLGKINRDSDTHSLGEIILSLNEFKLPEVEAVEVSTHRGAGQCSRYFSFKTTSSQAPFLRASHCHFQLFVNTGKQSVGS